MNNDISPIVHVLVLVLENRSYDHMLGYLHHGKGLTVKDTTRTILPVLIPINSK